MEMEVAETTSPSPPDKVDTPVEIKIYDDAATSENSSDCLNLIDTKSDTSTSDVKPLVSEDSVINSSTDLTGDTACMIEVDNPEDSICNKELNTSDDTINHGTESTMTATTILPETIPTFCETSSDITTFEDALLDNDPNNLSGSDETTSSDDDSGDDSWSSEDDIYENPYICEECDQEFYSYESLEIHKCIKQYGCPICTKTYDTIGKLVVHTKIHFAARACNYQKNNPAKRFRLDVDITSSETEKQRREATIIADDDEDRPHRCHICGKAFKHNHKLSQHIRTHSELYKCLICARSFSTKHNLKRHCKDVHNMDEYRYELVLLSTPMELDTTIPPEDGAKLDLKECLTSDNKEGESYTITSREMSSTDTDTKPLKCPECNKGFASQTGRQRHMKNHHPDKVPPPQPPGRKPGVSKKERESKNKDFYATYGVIKDMVNHVCEEKKYPFSSYMHLSLISSPSDAFIDEHSNQSNDSFTSIMDNDTSGELSSNVGKGFQLHRTDRFPIEKPHMCPECGKSFASKSYLKKHVKSNHDENSDAHSPTFTSEHQCPVCLRYFTSRVILAIHADIHSEDHCDDAIVVNAVLGDLILGVERRLNGSNYQNLRLECEDCGRHFASKQSLKRHALSHGRVLDFSNDPRFSKPNKIATHVRDGVVKSSVQSDISEEGATENGSPYICDICARPFTTYSGLRRHRIMHTSDPLIVKHLMTEIVSRVVAKVEVPKPSVPKPLVPIPSDQGTTVKFPCPECGKLLNSKKGLKQHLKLHEEKRLKRILEGKPPEVFPNAANNNLNTANTTVPNTCDVNPNIWQCEYCKKIFNNKHSLKRHTKIHTKGLVNATPPNTVTGAPSTINNFSTVVPGPEILATGIHSQVNGNISNLDDKAMGAINGVTSVDNMNGSTMDSKGFVKNSLIDIKDTMGGIYKCECCGKGFTTSDILAMHALTHLQDDFLYAKFTENLSGKLLKADDIKTEEMEPGSCYNTVIPQPSVKREGLVDTLKCGVCGKVFIVETELELHLLTHINTKEEPPFELTNTLTNGDAPPSKDIDLINVKPKEECNPIIDLSSDTAGQSSTTSKRDSSGPHCCPVCQKTFGTAASLGRHVSSHQGDPFPCEICGKEFAQFNRLTRHMRNHMKQFHCEICGKSFAENYTLKRHMKSHHKDVLPEIAPTADPPSTDMAPEVLYIKDEEDL